MAFYRKILCAVDLTDQCHLLVGRARALADTTNDITLIHIAEHPISGYGEQPGETHVVTEAQIRQQLFPKLKPLLDRHGLRIDQGRIEFGEPAHELHRMQQSGGYDLVIVGSHRLSKLRALFGSTPDTLMHEIHCDLLAVHLDQQQ